MSQLVNMERYSVLYLVYDKPDVPFPVSCRRGTLGTEFAKSRFNTFITIRLVRLFTAPVGENWKENIDF